MSKCPHGLLEMDIAVVTMRACPICLESQVSDLQKQVAELREHKAFLADGLMGMVHQFFDHDEDDPEIISHAFMSAEENAIGILIDLKLAEEVRPDKAWYKLKWDALAQLSDGK